MSSCAQALRRLEASSDTGLADVEEIKLYCQIPPINRMDNSLGSLKGCKRLSLSTNQIDRISNLGGLDSLEVLSLGRNSIKRLSGLDDVANTLEQLWVSYNQISSLDGLQALTNLTTLYISNNNLAWEELPKLQALPNLRDVVFKGSLPTDDMDEVAYRVNILRRVPQVSKIDGAIVTPEEREAALA